MHIHIHIHMQDKHSPHQSHTLPRSFYVHLDLPVMRSDIFKKFAVEEEAVQASIATARPLPLAQSALDGEILKKV